MARTDGGGSTHSFDTILRNLTGRPSGADVEPPEISWLRAYSNYLTPQLGVGSADAWAAIAIVVRNLILNWLIIIPVVCLVLLALKMIATASWASRTRIWSCFSRITGYQCSSFSLLASCF